MTAEMLLYAPADLVEVNQWILWRNEKRGANWTKVPYQVDGRRASSTDFNTWNSFEAVFEKWKQFPTGYSGIGFVFTEHDPFTGLDFDDCLDKSGNPKAWVRPLVERFSDTYTEVSPSAKGLKVFCKGVLPSAIAVKVEDGQIEMYDRQRYFTVTGRNFRNGPTSIEDHAADVMTLYERLTGRRGSYQMPKYGIGPEGKIPKGVQHLTLVSIAGSLRRRGICDSAIELCLQEVNRAQCEEPGPPANISRIVRSSRPWRKP